MLVSSVQVMLGGLGILLFILWSAAPVSRLPAAATEPDGLQQADEVDIVVPETDQPSKDTIMSVAHLGIREQFKSTHFVFSACFGVVLESRRSELLTKHLFVVGSYSALQHIFRDHRGLLS